MVLEDQGEMLRVALDVMSSALRVSFAAPVAISNMIRALEGFCSNGRPGLFPMPGIDGPRRRIFEYRCRAPDEGSLLYA